MPHYSFVKMHGLGNDFVVFDSRGPQAAASPLTESQLRTHARHLNPK
jgi:diaminopimelate epimerase